MRYKQALFIGSLCLMAAGGIVVSRQLARHYGTRIADTPSHGQPEMQNESGNVQMATVAQEESPATSNASRAIVTAGLRISHWEPKQTDTYQIAVANYSDVRFQFDNCMVTSPLIGARFKGGTTIMLDGRSPDPQLITIGNASIMLNGYDMVFVTLPIVTQSRQYSINCQMGDFYQYNITKITVEP
ncbi:MAG: hypothetical protein A3B30_00385 [Candidatus Komeilibacteria bacterium RIFCSPLOWO2_01_FULL_52_15]|uniref:Uncharacterized protein n=2 Tax=Candidatus Komeiliibacteriota TaxID=1817908 RepID=A0A1G2BT81_9BACT|nr:MAG: hypothetical protein A2677_03040 [Candidatus Komeilibacteria bacterium RIFCSPHIGHO2_01_FULL_52_14]OGY91789.1 MAG: hypothetical protein A3B30_00385 [Candidatus Komeilibacteria bacterium RIFCSPLOWO2_01_FULL_52_15]